MVRLSGAPPPSGPGRFLEWKMRLFMGAALLFLVAIALKRDILIVPAVVLLLVAFGMRMMERREEERREAEEAQDDEEFELEDETRERRWDD